ncbi:hypothetical protein C5B42_00545 [Candidatus Cerribacteria bacterium 'Amazon FNV 2010 28 9']|uniref:HNH endonuclease n=1 Tax=Candidatus Cerribacteria bacterium 'Amazon FNV 2010 28 9' TaxID=2081795 RepID=A0A317JRI8_9BACT|nr:MAG: hypothetical protein C5B42_00545 [Candidatus Cerribacteria bacterium 'Amazon FNV 2010 28 9']
MKRLFTLCATLGLVILAIAGVINTQSSPPTSPLVSPTSTPSPHVLGVSTGECHAQQVNKDDPQAYLPDPSCTPGVTNPAVTQDNLSTTICASGYTQTIRPSVTYTNKLKIEQIASYGYEDTDPKNYEEDHFISLELGGDPSDPRNLWPEPHASINEKDKVENYLHEQVCKGVMSLAQAQQKITSNWYAIYQTLH